MTTPQRTEIEWRYEPADLLEAPHRLHRAGYELRFEAGIAIAVLDTPVDAIPAALEAAIATDVDNVLLARQLRTHRKVEITGPQTRLLYPDGQRVVASVGTAAGKATVSGQSADVLITNASGKTVRGTRAERIAEDTRFIEKVSAAASRSSTAI